MRPDRSKIFIEDVWDFQLISGSVIIGALNTRDSFVTFFMTDQRIYTFPRILHIAYILCKIIVIKSSFTNSRKVQYFISINFVLISISGKEKLLLYPYKFSNSLGNV